MYIAAYGAYIAVRDVCVQCMVHTWQYMICAVYDTYISVRYMCVPCMVVGNASMVALDRHTHGYRRAHRPDIGSLKNPCSVWSIYGCVCYVHVLFSMSSAEGQVCTADIHRMHEPAAKQAGLRNPLAGHAFHSLVCICGSRQWRTSASHPSFGKLIDAHFYCIQMISRIFGLKLWQVPHLWHASCIFGHTSVVT